MRLLVDLPEVSSFVPFNDHLHSCDRLNVLARLIVVRGFSRGALNGEPTRRRRAQVRHYVQHIAISFMLNLYLSIGPASRLAEMPSSLQRGLASRSCPLPICSAETSWLHKY